MQHNTMQLTQDSHFSKKKLAASGWFETCDILRSRQMLYQLSYIISYPSFGQALDDSIHYLNTSDENVLFTACSTLAVRSTTSRLTLTSRRPHDKLRVRYGLGQHTHTVTLLYILHSIFMYGAVLHSIFMYGAVLRTDQVWMMVSDEASSS